MSVMIFVPRRKRKNALLRWVKLIGDYRYFRACGMTIRAAWWNAKNTI